MAKSLLSKIGNSALNFAKKAVLYSSIPLVIYSSSCDKEEPVPAHPTPAMEIKTEMTDSEGQVTFKDNSTLEEVILNVVDRNTQSPVPYVKVTYWDGKEFEVFMVDDPSSEYLPSLGIYPHNSTHTLETGRTENGTYEISRIEENNSLSEVAWSWKNENNMGFSTYNYEKTVDYDEYIEIKDRHAAVVDFMWEFIEYFWGKSLPVKPSQIVEIVAPEEENPPQRWDIYTYNNSGLRDYFTMIPSNIPEVEIDSLGVEENEVYASWKGTDKDTYDQFIVLPDNKDITKYIDGNTTSDLEYSYRVTEGGNVYGDDWTPYDSKVSMKKKILVPGDYSLEIKVKDEVENVGENSEDFSIGFETITDSRDNQIYDIVKIGDQWWMAENLNYGGRCYHMNKSNCETYGALYSWSRALNSCPTDWHLPSNEEWTELIDYLGGPDIAGGKMKSLELWNSPNTGATNESGFTALPAGYYSFVNSIYYYNMGNRTVFWSSTKAPGFLGQQMAYGFELNHNGESIGKNHRYQTSFGFSVRCIKDEN